jgi:phytoene dehydrogenase-like protein
LAVTVLEANEQIGGGSRTEELTLPAFRHDVCSAVHPLAAVSPFLRSLRLDRFGLELIGVDAQLAHPFDHGPATVVERSVEGTAAGMGPDRAAYQRLYEPLVRDGEALAADLLAPLRWPRHPVAWAGFARRALRSAAGLARSRFRGRDAKAVVGGMAAHGMMPLETPGTAAAALLLPLLAHLAGWPLAKGGSQSIASALTGCLRSLGGELETGRRISSLSELPPARLVMLDVGPRQLLEIAGDRLPAGYRRRLSRYRYGVGSFKVDYALSAPIPWRDQSCLRAPTVHLGATLEEIAISERSAWRGIPAQRPFVLLAQPSLFDPTRAPSGRHTAWAYCHVPPGCDLDMTGAIEAQIARFAPGFREVVLARHAMPPAALEAHDANFVGGDINAGVQDLPQLYARPVLRFPPYSTPLRGLYLCSSATPPGGGVHGMCGYWAARSALRWLHEHSGR